MIKIQIKSVLGSVLFEYEKENNTIAKTVEEAVERGINLRYANLRYANLSDADLSYANLRYANLRYADLSDANLSDADLSYANLSDADLSDADLSRYADLSDANLSDADLSYANLSDADLSDANLSDADLDFAMLYFSCKSLKPKTSEKQRIQLCFHFLSWIANAGDATDEEKAILEYCKKYANRFHRDDADRL